MNLTKKTLIGLPVYTQSEQHLGKVADFELDPATQLIARYYIKGGDLIKELLQSELIISREQVVTISTQRMVVEDAVVTEPETQKAAFKKAVPAG